MSVGESGNAGVKYLILNAVYNTDERLIQLTWGDGHQSIFHMIWLRDEDRSAACYDEATGQRLTDTAALPLDIGATEIRVTEGGRRLLVEWNRVVAGVERSAFDSDFLRSHCAVSAECRGADDCAVPPYAYTWGKELETLLPTLSVPYADLMQPGDAGELAVLRLLGMVRSYGVGVVSGTPDCKEKSQRAVERLAPVRHTLYGGFWETRVLPPDDADNIDSAYSTVPLPAHTDGNYLEDPPGLQIFHCLKADPDGGDTLLVDGFRAAEALRAKDPAAFALLAATPVTFRHADARHRLAAQHRVIGLDAAGRVARFHYNNLDRAPARLPPAQVPAFYRAWAALAAEVEAPAGRVWAKLRPGNLIVLNNRRVMHGRSQVTPGSGRVLVGCYVSYEDYLSRLSVLYARYGAGGGPAPPTGGDSFMPPDNWPLP